LLRDLAEGGLGRFTADSSVCFRSEGLTVGDPCKSQHEQYRTGRGRSAERRPLTPDQICRDDKLFDIDQLRQSVSFVVQAAAHVTAVVTFVIFGTAHDRQPVAEDL
jgi:hypothetical protein